MTNERFKEAVLQVFEEHGKPSLQRARIRTGIDHDTLARMKEGDVPRMDKIVAFARGFELDVNAWLRLAGYDPIEPSVDDAVEALVRAADEGNGEEDVAVFQYLDQAPISENDRRILKALWKGTRHAGRDVAAKG